MEDLFHISNLFAYVSNNEKDSIVIWDIVVYTSIMFITILTIYYLKLLDQGEI